ncbi:MAG: sodium/solute symporter [Planctomycetes bacterium]|nr:sodium/solute symporter [Planctomycetota bacterium]
MAFDIKIGQGDWLVLAAYLFGVVGFGIWIGRGQRDVAGYLLGGRDLPWWAILGSIVATETSTVTFLSIPGLAYAGRVAGASHLDPTVGGDMRFLQLALGMILGRWLIVHLLLPRYFQGNLFTAYQVLHERFGGATKSVASVAFLLARNVGDGLRLFLTAIVLREAIGASLPTCVVIVGVLTIIYTFAGGIKSVVWNDCIQLVVYVGGGLLALGIILGRLPDGAAQLLRFGWDHSKFTVLDFSTDISVPLTFWAGVVGGAFLALGTHGTDQMMVQRYLCARGERDAGRALIWSGLVVFLQFALFLMLGVGLACYYSEFPPAEAFREPDSVLSSFIVNELPAGVGLVGIILAAVFSAAMSTLSSSLNSSATSTLNDLYLPCLRKRPSDGHLLWVSRGLTVLFGLVQIGVGIAGMKLATFIIHDVLAIAGFTAGLLLGVFALGVLTRRAGQTAALSGFLSGLAVLVWVKFGTPVAWTWYALIGASVTFLIGLAVSCLWPRSGGEPTAASTE